MTTWTAPFIAADTDLGSAPILRREFPLDDGHGAVTAATLDVSALGVVEAWLGGQRVSDHLLEPGWTSYEWRIRVVSHDVTEHPEARARHAGADERPAQAQRRIAKEAEHHAADLDVGQLVAKETRPVSLRETEEGRKERAHKRAIEREQRFHPEEMQSPDAA